MTTRPPRLAERLLASRLPPGEREFVLGDLAEQYAVDLERGRRRAILRYWKEALAAAWQVRCAAAPTAPPRPRGDHLMSSFLYDLAKAAKALRRAPGFTVATASIAAVGLGATTAIFSVVNPILLRPLPYPAPDELVIVWEKDADGSNSRTGYATFADLAGESHTLQSSAVMGFWQPTISGGEGDPERLVGQRVSWRFFDMLGVKPEVGRSFVAAEDAPGQPRVVILTHGLWQRRFGGDRSIVGRTVSVDGEPIEVVGVLPAGFEDVFEPGTQVYRILGYDVSQPWACRTCRHLRMVGRIGSDVTHQAAAAELHTLSERIVAAHPTQYPAAGVDLVPVHQEVTRAVRPALLSVLVAVLFLLLIAGANVTTLGLARATRRREEFAMRRALGARRARLARQLLAEGLLLALLGGLAGVLIAWGAVRALVAYLPSDLPRLAAVKLDPAALGLAALVTLGLGVLVGLAPVATAGGRQAFTAIRGASRLVGPRRHAGRAGIVVAEVALSLMLLVGTGLLARSLLTLLSVNPGFDAAHLLTLEIQSTGPRYDDDAAVWSYHDRVREAVVQLPGVVAAAVTSQLPLGSNFDGHGIVAQDKPLPNPELAPGAQRYAVSAGYLAAMRVPLLEGRAFASADAADSAAKVAIVSASLARRIWAGESALGKQIQMGGRDWRTVVGVAGDVRHTGLETSDLHGFYVPERQWDWADVQVVLVVRTAGDPAALAPAVVRAVRSLDPTQPIMHVRTGAEVIATATAQRRLTVMLFAAFGVVATLLAAAGVYGVLSGAVAERRREIGIRSALGATPRAIVRLVLRQGLALAGVGLVLGLGGALALTRYLRAMLFGIEPTDPMTLSATVALLVAVALAACLAPARRAMRVDPVTALRAE
jgi:putative ABC transport system permease protein